MRRGALRNAEMREALKPLAEHAEYLNGYFSAEELAEMDQEHHLVASGITVAECFNARAILSKMEAT